MRILGIDPGVNAVGFGVIDDMEYVWAGTVKLRWEKNFGEKLLKIAREVERITKIYEPDKVFVEATIYHKNVKTAIQLGSVRGVIIFKLAEEGLDFEEISPTMVKISIAGNGQAKKPQIEFMVRHLLKLPESIDIDEHGFDALACAIAGYRSYVLSDRIRGY